MNEVDGGLGAGGAGAPRRPAWSDPTAAHDVLAGISAAGGAVAADAPGRAFGLDVRRFGGGGSRRSGTGRALRSVAIAVGLFALIGGGIAAMGMSGGGGLGSITGSDAGGGIDGSSTDPSADSYDVYHGENLDSNTYAPQYSRSDSTAHWNYDGPVDYSGYGTLGMQKRAQGASDPLYASVDPSLDGVSDVFDLPGVNGTDPTNGLPVGLPADPSTNTGPDGVPNSWTDPYADPYGLGYENPYLNRLRMTFGSWSSRTAWLDSPAP
jgi:hypothetical protein